MRIFFFLLYNSSIEPFISLYVVDNGDIFTGGWDGNIYPKDILRYNKNHTWEEVGQMKEARSIQAVEALEDVSQLCP